MKPNLLPMNLQMFAEEDGGTNFTFDDFKAFVESNEEAQKFVQSQSQSAADKQLEAWKQNNLEKSRKQQSRSMKNLRKIKLLNKLN